LGQGIKQRAERKVTEHRGEVEELPLLTGSNPVLTTKLKNKSMKTFINQKSEDMYLTLPFDIAQEVIGRMKVNGKCVIHLITTKVVDGCLKTTIKYHY